jgi:hypothetical protein
LDQRSQRETVVGDQQDELLFAFEEHGSSWDPGRPPALAQAGSGTLFGQLEAGTMLDADPEMSK